MHIPLQRLVIATRNAHKIAEIESILGECFEYLGLAHFPGAPPVVEDAATFAGNAVKKAVELARWIQEEGRWPAGAGGFVLADDSGLEVDALNGLPGVHSARFAALDTGAKGNSPDAENSAKLLHLMREVPPAKRTARFRCAVALVPVPGGNAEPESSASSPVCNMDELELRAETAEGVCEGRILFAPRGDKGFGYDPLFAPNGFDQTFAELGEEIKNRLSHRARALAALKRKLGRA